MGSLRIMRLAAGDAIVLQIKETLTQARADEVDATLQREFPGHKVVVLHGGWELSIIRQGTSAGVRAPDGVTNEEYDRMKDAWRRQHEGQHPGEIKMGWV